MDRPAADETTDTPAKVQWLPDIVIQINWQAGPDSKDWKETVEATHRIFEAKKLGQ